MVCYICKIYTWQLYGLIIALSYNFPTKQNAGGFVEDSDQFAAALNCVHRVYNALSSCKEPKRQRLCKSCCRKLAQKCDRISTPVLVTYLQDIIVNAYSITHYLMSSC